MMTHLIEFKSYNNAILRGIYCTEENSDGVVIMLGGYERSGTTEPKFKKLSDELLKKNISSFRYDNLGLGISDGNFQEITVKIMAEDLRLAIKKIQNNHKFKSISVVGHSLAACVIDKAVHDIDFKNIVIISPALNQKEILRYYYSVKVCPKVNITWLNYKKYLNEDEFLADGISKERMSKTSYAPINLFNENKELEYGDKLIENNVLHIHGESDNKAPKESVNQLFTKRIIVNDGDHDLERPDMMKQWLNQTVDFLT